MTFRRYYNLKDAAVLLLRAWGFDTELPRKGQLVRHNFPNGDVVWVQVHNQKSTYGKTLYRFTMKLTGVPLEPPREGWTPWFVDGNQAVRHRL